MRFIYDQSRNPSAPFIDMRVTGPTGKSSYERGKIDTGADMTVIPDYLVKSLGLEQDGSEYVTGIFGTRHMHTYRTIVAVGSVEFMPLSAVAMGRGNVLVGRDLINLWTMTMYGKDEACEIDPWSTDPGDAKG